MAADEIGTSTSAEADLAQAFDDLTKGERTAAALESHLTNLERKLDDFLASLNGDMPTAAQAVGMREEVGPGAVKEGMGGEHGKNEQ